MHARDPGDDHRGHEEAGHGGAGAGRGRHGNPDDHAAYLAKLLDPERLAWQKPDEVVAAMGLSKGEVVCEVGSGPGVFALRLAKAVGPQGRVYAIDVDPRMIAILESRAQADSIANISTSLSADGRGLPPEPVDAVLLANTFHHFTEPLPYLRELKDRLKPGGRIMNVDFHRRELPVGPPVEHLISREAFLTLAEEAGLRVLEEKAFLPYQYFLILGSR
jgi:ubiquinone/menaquinone biosynthesis C-methylase UbiE